MKKIMLKTITKQQISDFIDRVNSRIEELTKDMARKLWESPDDMRLFPIMMMITDFRKISYLLSPYLNQKENKFILNNSLQNSINLIENLL